MDSWRKVQFKRMEAVVFSGRPDSFPKGYNFYGIRHAECDWDGPISVEPTVVVNFWGYLGVKGTLKFQEGCNWITLSSKERGLLHGGY